MKLGNVDFYMDWPVSVEVKNLRKFIFVNLENKGKVIRWSIVEIQNAIDSYGSKKLKIKAVLAN